jgi:hypothetical protein
MGDYYSVLLFLTWGKAVAPVELVASLEGFEPPTRCLEGSRSIHLSYRDVKSYA